MLPSAALSSVPVPGEFLYPDSTPFSPFEDFEYGGKAHQDPSMGLRVKVWRGFLDDGYLTIQDMTGETDNVRFRYVGEARYVSLSFDQNMRVIFSWYILGASYLYWYDSSAQNYVTTQYAGCFSPRLTHDDKRPLQSASSDVILAYIRGTSLCFRAQRDRYGIEYVLSEVEAGLTLRRVGMTDKNRVQFELLAG